ncbi:MAG: universal stress protein [Pirellula sp.]
MTKHPGYLQAIVATDFSPAAKAAVQQAIWLSRTSGAKLAMTYAAPDSMQSFKTAHEIRQESAVKMKEWMEDLGAADLDVPLQTRIGQPIVVIVHAVQQGGFDLVLAGSRGLGDWTQFLVGSTAKRLVRNCPVSVWIVKSEVVGPPKVILAPTDLSDVSRKAIREGLWLAEQSGAEFHVLHVVDSQKVRDEEASKQPPSSSSQQEIEAEAMRQLEEFLRPLETAVRIHSHVTQGVAWQEIGRMAQQLNADLIAIGTVGRSGVKGMLLGNTAEKVLDTCDCSMLTVKRDGFVSPIE